MNETRRAELLRLECLKTAGEAENALALKGKSRTYFDEKAFVELANEAKALIAKWKEEDAAKDADNAKAQDLLGYIADSLDNITSALDRLTAVVERLAPAKETDNQIFTRIWAKWTAKEPSEPTPEPPRTCGECVGCDEAFVGRNTCPDFQPREVTL